VCSTGKKAREKKDKKPSLSKSRAKEYYLPVLLLEGKKMPVTAAATSI